jgi:hypothetical protein
MWNTPGVGTRRCAVAIAAVVAVAAALAPAAQAGSVRVPLDRADPWLGHITVRYAVLRHTDRTRPPLEPVVAFEGGPGYGSIGSASTYLFMLGKLHRRHDLIVMDQRGTGTSGAIDCPALQNGIPPYTAATAACARRLGRTWPEATARPPESVTVNGAPVAGALAIRYARSSAARG